MQFMKHISVHAFKEVVDTEGNNASVDFINVCTPVEYNEKHIPGVRNVPLDQLEQRIDEFKDKKTIYIHCRSGRRGVTAMERLKALGVTAELVNVEGGMLAWDEAGFRTASRVSARRLPLMRQTFLAAGSLVVLGVLLGILVDESYVYVSLFVGMGLMFSGATGWCGLQMLLSRMPWNR